MTNYRRDATEITKAHPPNVSRYQLASAKAAREFSSLLNVDHVLHTVADTLTSDFDAKLVRVWLYEPGGDTLHRRVNSGTSNTDIEVPMSREGLPEYPYEVRRVLESKDPFVNNELSSSPNFDAHWVFKEDLASVAAFPLIVADELRGVLVHFCAARICDEALVAIETLSTLAAISLNDMRLFDELGRSEERYRTFVERGSEGLWRERFDVPLPTHLPEEEQIRHVYQHLILSEVNDPMARQYGYSRGEELEGTPVREMIPPTQDNLQSMMDFARAGYQMSDMELREYDRHGEVKYFSLNLVGVIEDGFITEFWGTQRDITDRKLAEIALGEAEEKYRGLFENALEGIFQSTLEGEIITVNPAMASILGYDSPQEALANVPTAAAHLYADPEDRRRMTSMISAHGEVSDFETRFLRKDGSEVWVSLNVRAISATEPAGLTSSGRTSVGRTLEGTVEDITERRQAERTLSETRQSERRRLARDLHDTALQDITYASQEMNVCRILSTDPATIRRLEEGNEALRRAVSELRHAIYDLREGDPGGRPFERSLEILVQRGRRMFQGCEITLSLQGDTQNIRQDSRAAIELLRVVQEAISNARKHSRANRLRIGVNVGDKTVNTTISDDGVGFDPREQPEGTGSKSMRERVAEIGGEIDLRSSPGRGTCLEVRLPAGAILRSSPP